MTQSSIRNKAVAIATRIKTCQQTSPQAYAYCLERCATLIVQQATVRVTRAPDMGFAYAAIGELFL